MRRVYAVVSQAQEQGGWLVRRCDDAAIPLDEPELVSHGALAATINALERSAAPRWIFASSGYPELLAAGVRVARCHDLALTEGILLAFEGRHGEPRSLAASWARLAGFPVPMDTEPGRGNQQPALFESANTLPSGAAPEDAAPAVLGDQLRRIAATPWAGQLRLLVAAESAGALAAAEMRHNGLPWDADIHRAMLTELLGPRPAFGAKPIALQKLAAQVSNAFGDKPVNPEHPGSVVHAFAREGIEIPSARAAVLREVDHPAIEPLLQYKELTRLYAAHGWAWLDEWVHNGRFAPEYVVGGVVSGRWATRGGAALQLPKVLRTCVRAEPGYQLVVADAAQLEPRILAALSADPRFAELAAAGDLYASLAADAFEGRRQDAKIAMLSAMYGGTAGSAAALLIVLRKRFPAAMDYVELAARRGEAGRTVRSVLGRTSPPPSAAWRELTENTEASAESASRKAARDWGRFTRNFVVQASASDWALTMLAGLRLRLLRELPAAELVFFQHDEIIVHCKESETLRCTELIATAAAEATTLVFGDTPVRFPLPAAVVDCYADAK